MLPPSGDHVGKWCGPGGELDFVHVRRVAQEDALGLAVLPELGEDDEIVGWRPRGVGLARASEHDGNRDELVERNVLDGAPPLVVLGRVRDAVAVCGPGDLGFRELRVGDPVEDGRVLGSHADVDLDVPVTIAEEGDTLAVGVPDGFEVIGGEALRVVGEYERVAAIGPDDRDVASARESRRVGDVVRFGEGSARRQRRPEKEDDRE